MGELTMSLIRRARRQFCVLWRSIAQTTRSLETYEAPVLVQCRWESKNDTVTTEFAESVPVTAYLMLPDDEPIKSGDVLFGPVTDLSDYEGDEADPLAYGGIRVRKIEILPNLRANESLVEVWAG